MLKERKVEEMSTNFAVHSPNVLHLYIGKEEVIENELVPLSVFVVFCRFFRRLTGVGYSYGSIFIL